MLHPHGGYICSPGRMTTAERERKAPVARNLPGSGESSMVTEAGIIAFLKMVIELFVKERNALKAAGLDVDLMLSAMRNLLEQAAQAEQQQEAMKRQSKAATEAWYSLKRTAYVTTSGYLDMAIAAVSKDSSMAKNFRKVRSRLNRPNKAQEGDAPIAVPAKP